MSGAFNEVLKLIQNKLNFTYEVRPSPSATYGTYNKSLGQWTGIFGELERKEIDFAVMDTSVYLERLQAIIQSLQP